MTDDLAKRLTEAADQELRYAREQDFWHEDILREAAARIAALEADLARARERVEALERAALKPAP